MAKAVSVIAFLISATLAIAGIAAAILGIFGDDKDGWRFVLTGFISLLGAGVFATLYLGSRRKEG